MVYFMATIFGDVQYSQVMGHLPTPAVYLHVMIRDFGHADGKTAQICPSDPSSLCLFAIRVPQSSSVDPKLVITYCINTAIHWNGISHLDPFSTTILGHQARIKGHHGCMGQSPSYWCWSPCRGRPDICLLVSLHDGRLLPHVVRSGPLDFLNLDLFLQPRRQKIKPQLVLQGAWTSWEGSTESVLQVAWTS